MNQRSWIGPRWSWWRWNVRKAFLETLGLWAEFPDDLVGSNDVGMLAWKLTLKTPEYPEGWARTERNGFHSIELLILSAPTSNTNGSYHPSFLTQTQPLVTFFFCWPGRELILIANDVTFQAGSFGVREDQFFQKASELARVKGLPRIYVSCNSGGDPKGRAMDVGVKMDWKMNFLGLGDAFNLVEVMRIHWKYHFPSQTCGTSLSQSSRCTSRLGGRVEASVQGVAFCFGGEVPLVSTRETS